MVEDVVELRPELDLDPLDRGIELLVEVQIGLVEGWRAAVVLGQTAKWTGNSIRGDVADVGGGQIDRRRVHILHRAVGELCSLDIGNTSD